MVKGRSTDILDLSSRRLKIYHHGLKSTGSPQRLFARLVVLRHHATSTQAELRIRQYNSEGPLIGDTVHQTTYKALLSDHRPYRHWQIDTHFEAIGKRKRHIMETIFRIAEICQ